MIWKIIRNIQLFWKKCKDDNINAFAAQTAFFVILSFIPFMMVFCSLLQYTSLSEGIILDAIQKMMPDYIAPLIITVVDEIYNNSVGIISITAVLAIWSAAKGIQYLSNGLNVVNELNETRSWLVLRIRATFYTFVFLIAILVLIVLLIFGRGVKRMVVSYSPIMEEITNKLHPFRFLIILFILMILLVTMYKALPNNKPSVISQIPGAVLCGIAWYIFSFGLSVYVKYFNGFSMYGSLTTIVLLMLWLYFCIYILLLCAEVNYLYGHYFCFWVRQKRK